jgi:hypothetical protein
VDIDFKRPSTSSRKSIQPAKRKRINEPSEELQSQFIQQLQETYPESAILTAFIPVRPTTTGSSLDQRIRSLPYTLASYYDPKYSTYTQEELIEESRGKGHLLLLSSAMQASVRIWFAQPYPVT